jgi:hypothetical protein
MRSTTAFTLGVLVSAGAFVAIGVAPSALGGDEKRPAAAPVAGGQSVGAPKKEAAITHPLLKAMAAEWGCDCAYPTGGHASGEAEGEMILDGTALAMEGTLEFKSTGSEKSEIEHSLSIWKVGADGKSVTYWGFSSHDDTADMLSGTLSDSSVTVSGTTRWGPMRRTISLKDGVLSSQLWIDKQDMGVVSYKKAEAKEKEKD